MVGRKNVDISLLWAAMPSTLRTTAVEDQMYHISIGYFNWYDIVKNIPPLTLLGIVGW